MWKENSFKNLQYYIIIFHFLPLLKHFHRLWILLISNQIIIKKLGYAYSLHDSTVSSFLQQ